MHWPTFWIAALWIAAWYLLISVVTFIAYGIDKRKARLSKWRVKEQTLHIMEMLGGWPGGFIAQRVFRHKWKKTKYLVVFYAIVTVHVLIWAAVIYRVYLR
jgi:uncharacterized membrane protein YsdA (DUF1294 family)